MLSTSKGILKMVEGVRSLVRPQETLGEVFESEVAQILTEITATEERAAMTYERDHKEHENEKAKKDKTWSTKPVSPKVLT